MLEPVLLPGDTHASWDGQFPPTYPIGLSCSPPPQGAILTDNPELCHPRLPAVCPLCLVHYSVQSLSPRKLYLVYCVCPYQLAKWLAPWIFFKISEWWPLPGPLDTVSQWSCPCLPHLHPSRGPHFGFHIFNETLHVPFFIPCFFGLIKYWCSFWVTWKIILLICMSGFQVISQDAMFLYLNLDITAICHLKHLWKVYTVATVRTPLIHPLCYAISVLLSSRSYQKRSFGRNSKGRS